MESETHSLIVGFDISFMVQLLPCEILYCMIPIEAYADLRTVFYVTPNKGKGH